MGGGRLRACAGRSPTPRSPLVIPMPSRHSCALSSFLRPLVIPAQAGTYAASKLQLPPTVLPYSRRTKVRAMPTSLRANRPRVSGAASHPDHALNKPEQIRTNLNIAAAHSPSFLRRQEPTRAPTNSPKKIHPSPLLADLRITP